MLPSLKHHFDMLNQHKIPSQTHHSLRLYHRHPSVVSWWHPSVCWDFHLAELCTFLLMSDLSIDSVGPWREMNIRHHKLRYFQRLQNHPKSGWNMSIWNVIIIIQVLLCAMWLLFSSLKCHWISLWLLPWCFEYLWIMTAELYCRSRVACPTWYPASVNLGSVRRATSQPHSRFRGFCDKALLKLFFHFDWYSIQYLEITTYIYIHLIYSSSSPRRRLASPGDSRIFRFSNSLYTLLLAPSPKKCDFFEIKNKTYPQKPHKYHKLPGCGSSWFLNDYQVWT